MCAWAWERGGKGVGGVVCVGDWGGEGGWVELGVEGKWKEWSIEWQAEIRNRHGGSIFLRRMRGMAVGRGGGGDGEGGGGESQRLPKLKKSFFCCCWWSSLSFFFFFYFGCCYFFSFAPPRLSIQLLLHCFFVLSWFVLCFCLYCGFGLVCFSLFCWRGGGGVSCNAGLLAFIYFGVFGASGLCFLFGIFGMFRFSFLRRKRKGGGGNVREGQIIAAPHFSPSHTSLPFYLHTTTSRIYILI